MANKEYQVEWKGKATRYLAKLFNVNPHRIYRNSKHVLSVDPYKSAEDYANFPNYEFNGYFWLKVENVILIYSIDSDEKIVSIEDCHHALTGEVAEMFYGVSLDEE